MADAIYFHALAIGYGFAVLAIVSPRTVVGLLVDAFLCLDKTLKG